MCRKGVLPLMAALVAACSCSSVDLSIIPGRGMDFNASSTVVPVTNATGTVGPVVNASGQAVAGRNRTHGRSSLNEEEATSSTQAVIWVSSLVPSVFSPTYLCTGAVIGRELVITSATCVRRYSKGRLTVSEAQENLSESYRFANVASMNMNEELDVALLRLDVAEFFTQSSVSKMVDDADTLVTGDKCTVSGWPYVTNEGKNVWQIQNVSYMSAEDCIDVYSTVMAPMNDKLICATPEVGNYSCSENIGWPLFCNGELVGLYSWTYFSCHHPGVYSSMKVSAPWITAATSGVDSVVVNPSVITASVLMIYYIVIRAFSY